MQPLALARGCLRCLSSQARSASKGSEVLAALALRVRPVVHRDLKPSNILLRREGGKVELVVADFGIGQVLRAELNPMLRSTNARNAEARRKFEHHDYTGTIAALDLIRLIRLRDNTLYRQATGNREFLRTLRAVVSRS